MKLNIIIYSLTILFARNCKKDTSAQTASPGSMDCFKNKIESFQKQNNCASAHIDEMNFQAKTVYVFDPGNCGADMTKDVMDADCKLLGVLGGIAGNTKIDGVEFSQAKFVKTIWNRN